MINWGLATGPNAFENAFARGQQLGGQIRENRVNSALSDYAMNPQDPDAFKGLAKNAPRLAVKIGEDRRQAEKAAQEEGRAKLVQMADILDSAEDEASYQQGLQVAQQFGLPVENVPPQYDPAWVNQQRLITSVFLDKKDDLPGIAQELQAAGYDINTPEGQEAMRSVINNKYAADYMDEAGNTRRRSALKLPPPSAAPQQSDPVSKEEGEEIVRGWNDAGYATKEQIAIIKQGLGGNQKALDDYIQSQGLSIVDDEVDIDGTRYYEINGKLYDNPEGR